jgi:hypothetical protein
MEVRKDLAQWLRQNEKFKIDMNAAELSEFQEDSSTCWYDCLANACFRNLFEHY